MSEKIGEIRITKVPTFISKGHKYLAEVRAFEPIKKMEYEYFDVLSQASEPASIEKWKQVKRLSGRLGKAIEKMDKEHGDVFYHYQFYILTKEKYDPEDISAELEEHLKDNEGVKVQSIIAKRLRLFPWERPRTMKIPITKNMMNKMLQKRKGK